jgi:hypothetical protein
MQLFIITLPFVFVCATHHEDDGVAPCALHKDACQQVASNAQSDTTAVGQA